MYTFNYYCFGHKLSENKELNNLLHDYDVELRKNINGKSWEIDFPYHGGQIRGDVYSCVFGTIITDDDHNTNYVDEIRNSKEEDYIEDYNKFIEILLTELEKDVESAKDSEPEFEKVFNMLKEFLSKNSPKFYSVEASS